MSEFGKFETGAGGWRVSSYCQYGSCVAVRRTAADVQVRDSKDPDGPVLTFTHREWKDFLAGVRKREFDLR